MRILIVEGSRKIPTFICNLSNGVSKSGNAVAVMSGSRKGLIADVQFMPLNFRTFTGIQMIVSILINGILNPSLTFQARSLRDHHPSPGVRLKRWYRIIQMLKFKPDVIHFQWASHLVDYENFVRNAGIPIAVSLRGRHINILPFIDDKTAAFYKSIFPLVYFHAVSSDIALNSKSFGASDGKIQIVFSPVPVKFTDAFNPLTNPSRVPLKIVSIGRFMWKKGYTYAITAIKLLLGRGIPVTYTIIAQGEIPDEIIYQIEQQGLKDVVKIKAGIPYEQIAQSLKGFSLFLLPSLEEGIANVVLESMAVGLPVLSTNCGGMSEVIQQGDNGMIVPVRNPLAIADAIGSYLSLSDEKIMAMRMAAHRTIVQNFSEAAQIQKFNAFYHWVQQSKPEK